MKNIARTVLIGSIAGFMLFTSGCLDKQAEPYRDAKISKHINRPVEIYDDADGFSNVSEFCDKHGNRIVVAFHNDDKYAAIAAIPQDSSCK